MKRALEFFLLYLHLIQSLVSSDLVIPGYFFAQWFIFASDQRKNSWQFKFVYSLAILSGLGRSKSYPALDSYMLNILDFL